MNIRIEIPEVQADREIISTRTVNYPSELVFSAWSHPDHLKNWGPKDFTNTFEEFNFQPGGRWKFVMHGPEGGNYPNEVEFIDIERPYFIFWKRHSKPFFKIAAIFEEVSDHKTFLTFRMIFDTPEECEKLRKYVVDKNEENFDKLEEELRKMSLGSYEKYNT